MSSISPIAGQKYEHPGSCHECKQRIPFVKIKRRCHMSTQFLVSPLCYAHLRELVAKLVVARGETVHPWLPSIPHVALPPSLMAVFHCSCLGDINRQNKFILGFFAQHLPRCSVAWIKVGGCELVTIVVSKTMRSLLSTRFLKSCGSSLNTGKDVSTNQTPTNA